MKALRYRNPLWPGYFADPFVLRVDSKYYAYGTGPADAKGREFPVLRSADLIHWESVGGALDPISIARPGSYWAPEVAEKDRRFALFYSASTSASDQDQHLRVAVADDPAGPFTDSGHRLMPDQGFCIDASPFMDPRDGCRYLFFATDFEQDEPAGTGISVVSLTSDMMKAAGSPRMVVRASASWHLYEKNRDYKGRTWPAWNCVEGPSVIYHEGKYYCFYSGGAWHSDNYGVDFAIADHPLGPWKPSPDASGPAVLRGIPGKVIGPGHNSVVLGPDERTLFMVYHAWDPSHTLRRMCIDPIRWTGSGPRVEGPSTEMRTLL